METKHKPATPLPWITVGTQVGGLKADKELGDHVCGAHSDTDAAYIVAAANNYPRLVAALREVTSPNGTATSEIMANHTKAVKAAKTLLAELGEA